MADRENEIYASAVSALEISTKFRLGKLPDAPALAGAFQEQLDAEGFFPLPVQVSHAQLAGGFRDRHQDPFDRMLIAQALIEGLVLVSNEGAFDGFGVQRLW